jgi:hypothetical protein
MPPMKVVGRFTVQGDYASIEGSGAGGLAIFGDPYDHVGVAVGLNANPLIRTHQVAYWTALNANAFCDGVDSFLAGFESGIGIAAGSSVVERVAHFTCGSLPIGAGSSATRVFGLKLIDNVTGVNNVGISTDADVAFLGNWFIHYIGTRPSLFGGTVHFADAVQIDGNVTVPTELRRAVQNSFARLAGGDFTSAGANIIVFGPTHATAANQMQLNATDSVAMNTAKHGFYGVTPIARALLATGASHTVDDVITALQNLGLVRQS